MIDINKNITNRIPIICLYDISYEPSYDVVDGLDVVDGVDGDGWVPPTVSAVQPDTSNLGASYSQLPPDSPPHTSDRLKYE